MKITSFDDTNHSITRDINQGELYDIFQKNIMIPKKNNIVLYSYVVPREFEMRIDKISNFLYGSPDYVEELMTINDILNPYSVKEGQIFYYCKFDYIRTFYVKDDMKDNDSIRNSLINSSRSNDNFDFDGDNLPLTIKPKNLKQITITDDNKVKIINSFE